MATIQDGVGMTPVQALCALTARLFRVMLEVYPTFEGDECNSYKEPSEIWAAAYRRYEEFLKDMESGVAEDQIERLAATANSIRAHFEMALRKHTEHYQLDLEMRREHRWAEEARRRKREGIEQNICSSPAEIYGIPVDSSAARAKLAAANAEGDDRLAWKLLKEAQVELRLAHGRCYITSAAEKINDLAGRFGETAEILDLRRRLANLEDALSRRDADSSMGGGRRLRSNAYRLERKLTGAS